MIVTKKFIREYISGNVYVKLINLDDKDIKYVENDAFDGLFCLEKLYMSCNKIVNTEFVENLKSLKFLYLGYNKIEHINLSKLVLLEELCIRSNNIKSMVGCKKLKNLKKFTIYNNGFHKIEGLEKPDTCELQKIGLSIYK